MNEKWGGRNENYDVRKIYNIVHISYNISKTSTKCIIFKHLP